MINCLKKHGTDKYRNVGEDDGNYIPGRYETIEFMKTEFMKIIE